MTPAFECPICYDIPTPQDNPAVELCTNKHSACTNCVRELARKAISGGVDPRCMLCRAPVVISQHFINPIDKVLQKLRREPLNPDHWAQLGLTLGNDEHVIFRGKIYTKQRCFKKASKLST